jgi:hypothetical protein
MHKNVLAQVYRARVLAKKHGDPFAKSHRPPAYRDREALMAGHRNQAHETLDEEKAEACFQRDSEHGSSLFK